MSVAERLREVRARIAAACLASGRDPAAVELVAVSKTRGAGEVRAALAAGQRAFGENRVQELVAKAAELEADGPDWHMVGSLQTNKVNALLRVPRLALLQSLDRRRLADVLQARLAGRGARLAVLLQIEATGEASKHGSPAGHAEELLRHVLERCPALEPRGLMAMAPLEGDPGPVFARVAALRAALADRLGVGLPVLSLGMTADLEAAIAAGATMVRVGTGIFGPRPAP